MKVGFEKWHKEARLIVIHLLKQDLLTIAQIAEGLNMPVSLVLKIQKELEKNPNLN
jgi:predicted transposase YdaD